MIEEVVNSILEAEDAAKNRIAEAEKQAGEIIAAAEVNAEKKRKEITAHNKALFAEKIKESELTARQEADKRLDALKKEADAQINGYAKNVDKAVKIILESL